LTIDQALGAIKGHPGLPQKYNKLEIQLESWQGRVADDRKLRRAGVHDTGLDKDERQVRALQRALAPMYAQRHIVHRAQQMMDEGHDDVKQMNQMMLYSKVVTIRDRQLEEAKRLEQEWVEEQKRLDLMMEIERLKSLKLQEEREFKRKEAQKQGSLVIIDQIKERELDRIKE
jgi:hypothetical protein